MSRKIEGRNLSKLEVMALVDVLEDTLAFMDQEDVEEFVDGKLIDKIYTGLEVLGVVVHD